MTEHKDSRGGPGRGQGRKPETADGAMVPVTIKMTEPQRTKLKELGGGKWVREKIDRAKLPND